MKRHNGITNNAPNIITKIQETEPPNNLKISSKTKIKPNNGGNSIIAFNLIF
jgi:hypothetical protein